MTETMQLLILCGTPILYSLGGMFWKPMRRFGIPLLFIACSIMAGVVSWQISLAILGTCIALHLGYGEGGNWIRRIIYAVCISIPTLLVKFSPWCFVLPIVFLGTFYLSNLPKWQYVFNWRICEFLVGAFLGILWVSIL